MQERTLMQLQGAASMLQAAVKFARQDGEQVLPTKDHIKIIRHYDNLRSANEIIKEARKALDEMAEQWSREFVPEAMREARVKTMTLEGVGRITISHRWSASIVEGKKPEAFQWVREANDGGIIQETINSSTLSAYAKSKFEGGVELPVHLFKVGQMAFTSITKAK